MSTRSSLLASPILPALLCLGLGAAVYLELQRPVDPVAAASVPGAVDVPAVNAPVPALFDLPPADAFIEIVERPVFSPNRRPPSYLLDEPEDFEPAAAVRRQDLDVTVVGIITGPRALALLRAESSDRLVPLAVGQKVSGWTLTAIEPFRVVFNRDGEERSVDLEFREE